MASVDDGRLTLAPGYAKLFAEIGFLGVSRGHLDEADTVFAALETMRPGHEIGPLGRAVVAMARNDFRSASRILSAAPQTDAVAAFRALALARLGDRAEAATILEDLADTAQEEAIADLAEEVAKSL